MKTGRIFWGALFIIIGGLLLLEKLNVVDLEWHFAWRLWPLLLIFWGAALLIRNPQWKWVAALVGAVVVVVVLLNAGGFLWSIGEFGEGARYSQELTEPFDSAVNKASLSVHGAAGIISLKDTTGQLIIVSTQTNYGRYSLDKERIGEEAKVYLAFEGKRIAWRGGKASNWAAIRLNASPVWDMDIDVGAAKLDLDLAPFAVEDIMIDAGATSLRVKIGERAKETHLRIDAGASSIRISVPSASACEARFEGGLSSKNLPGFQRVDSRMYRTENFDTAAKKIVIDIHAGVSSIKVVRY
jgi:hypothetical protein